MSKIQNRYSGKKMHEQIMRDTPNERERYEGGGPGPRPMDRDKEIQKLSNIVL